MNKSLKLVKLISFVSVVSLLASCASTLKKAQENLEAGSYEEAVRLYEKAVQENPDSQEASAGLLKAREGAIDKELIEVRMTRLGGSQQQACDLLLTTLVKEKAWKFAPKSKVAFTQSEETEFANRFIRSRIDESLQRVKPLQAEMLLHRYHLLFQEVQEAKLYHQIENTVLASGAETCKNLQKNDHSTAPYFSEFLNRYCNHYQTSCKNCAKWARTRLRDLYSSAQVATEIAGIPDGTTPLVKSELEAALRESPWYDPEGSHRAPLQIKGSYQYSFQKTPVNLVKNYVVSEPYETIQQVMRPHDVPYQVWDSVLQTWTTQYRTEYISQPEVVVEYHDVQKQYPYTATKHEQSIHLMTVVDAQLVQHPISFSFQKSLSQEGIEHNLDLPNIGLTPSRAQLTDPQAWLNQESTHLKKQFQEKLQNEWVSAFCNPDTSMNDQEVLSDRVQKCVRSPVKTPDFVQNWYKNQLGVDYDTAQNIISNKLD